MNWNLLDMFRGEKPMDEDDFDRMVGKNLPRGGIYEECEATWRRRHKPLGRLRG